MRNFKDFEIWQISMQIAETIYQVTKRLPESEKFGLQSQMRRSAVSMSSNIAEGCSRRPEKVFANYLEISLGSSFELQSQLMLSSRISYLKEENLIDLFEALDKFQRKTNALLSRLRR